MPRDSPHCAISSAARISSPCVRGFPWGEAKLKRSTVSNTSGPAWLSGLGLHERGEVGEQRAVDDRDAGAHGVDVVREQRKLRTGHPRYFGGHLEGEAGAFQQLRGLGEIVGEVAEVMHGVARC